MIAENIALGVLGLVLAWNLLPCLLVAVSDFPSKHKWAAIRSFLFSSFPKGLLILPIDLAAPVVVPIALMFTAWSADRLPRLFYWWDNDVSINGDRPEYWSYDYVGDTYYAKAHPRSFWARYVWLGWRNRASKLSVILGYKKKELDAREYFGDPLTNRDHEGSVLFRIANVYQLYIVKRIGNHCIRVNYGHKVWEPSNTNPIATVVNISLSFLRWKGEK